MRGKVTNSLSELVNSRITPAYAGKREVPRYQVDLAQDHPRLCGEKHHVGSESIQLQGSPPPMRGKAPFKWLIYLTFRITPAYAGKSSAEL